MEALTDACVLCGNRSLELSAKCTSGKLRRPRISVETPEDLWRSVFCEQSVGTFDLEDWYFPVQFVGRDQVLVAVRQS